MKDILNSSHLSNEDSARPNYMKMCTKLGTSEIWTPL